MYDRLLERGERDQKILFLVDSRSAIQAINSPFVESILVNNAISWLNMLAENNYVRIQWVKAHVGHTGNERADKCAKEGAIDE